MRQTYLFGVASLFALIACSGERRYPLVAPMRIDDDMHSVNIRCRPGGACAPVPYVSPLYWDGSDNLIFRPLSSTLGIVTSGESLNVNSVDEVPDSSWFTNRTTVSDLELGACTADQILDPEAATDGSWLVDQGKMDGETSGFRVVVPGHGKYVIKLEDVGDQPERQSAAATIGSAILHAAGYNMSCEQLLYVKPSTLKLKSGLTVRTNFEPAKPFDQSVLDGLLAKSPKRDGRIRVSASAWMPGYGIGPFTWHGTRSDDPNDIIPHEDRRELRGMGVLAAWIDRTDAREANSYDTWMADDATRPQSSPGHVVHYQFDWSEIFGGDWNWAPPVIQRRVGMSYLIDWGDVARDLFTLGAQVRPWEDLVPVKGHELFGYFELRHFDPALWKNEFPNEAFQRMSERDAAWMARILTRFTPSAIHTLVRRARFTDPSNTSYLEYLLEGRLHKVFERYLTKLSPIGDLIVDKDRLCGVDFAERVRLRPPTSFHYRARLLSGPALAVTRGEQGAICVALHHDSQRYLRVEIDDDVAHGKLVAHLYDLGPNGFALVAAERK